MVSPQLARLVAGPVLLLGAASQSGLFGSNRNLEEIVRDDAAATQDLRQIQKAIAFRLVTNDHELILPNHAGSNGNNAGYIPNSGINRRALARGFITMHRTRMRWG